MARRLADSASDAAPNDAAPLVPDAVDVDALVTRIRAEIARHRAAAPPSTALPAPPPPGPSALDSAISAAAHHASVGTTVPDWPERRWLWRKLGRLVARLVMHLSVFLTKEQREFNRRVLDVSSELARELRQLDASLRQTQANVAFLEDATRHRAEQVEERLATHERSVHERLATHEQRVDDRFAAARGGAEDLERRMLRVQTNLTVQEARLTTFLAEARRRLGAAPTPADLESFVAEAKRMADGLYAAFEERFRGSREEIKERLRVYVPILREAVTGPVLDLGCGRGELLELLQDEGIAARGVDRNTTFLDACRARGLDVVDGDALRILATLPDASFAAVTAIHLIEHLGFDDLLALLDQTVRVLRPGGVAIFETPNPANLLVGSCNFWCDPTHRQPIPMELAEFLAEARGLCRVRILPLHPYPEVLALHGSDVAQRLSEQFYGPQDYAVIGYRP
jgi:SAM-dependent methyltransferase